MTDQAATIIAFAISLGVLAGYGVGVLTRLRHERTKQHETNRSGESPERPNDAVIAEVKPESPVKTS